MASIYDLSWGADSFPAKLKLFFKSRKHEKQKMLSYIQDTKVAGYSALSSTYYSIAATAAAKRDAIRKLEWFSRVSLILLWGLTWLPLGGWCYLRMLPLSNRTLELVGYEGMTADQCDVRQSILRRRGRYDEAKKCIRIALAKNPEKAHTRGLLHVGLAGIYQHEGDWHNAETEVQVALVAARDAEEQNPRQAARIYRHCANVTDFIEQGDPIPGSQLRTKARKLAKAAGAKDQLLKQS